MKDINYYELIFKRKSFHLFDKIGAISKDELLEIENFLKGLKPLDPNIRFKTKIVKESDTTCKRGAEYCIELYSEIKDNYLRNIGYIGEEIDLYLTSKNIGTLWFGIGKPDSEEYDGLKYVIMIAFAKKSNDSFRKDMFKAKRKELDEIWTGDNLNVANIVRFSPSACNSQPWFVENNDGTLSIYRVCLEGKRGIMPKDKVCFYNRIDIGIFLFILEECLHHEGYSFEAKQYYEEEPSTCEKVLVAEYSVIK